MNDPVLYEVRDTTGGKSIGIATLNIENRLNSTSLELVRSLSPKLEAWARDDQIACVVIRGAGEKAFCAGGDCIDMYHSMVEDPSLENRYAQQFFSEEYSLFYLIHVYPKPVITWGSGIVMGAGLGLMCAGSHRIVTERSLLAMPEISIGLYPDAGGSWFLGRTPGRSGLFLGLTGSKMNATDARFLGLATHSLDSTAYVVMLDALASVPWTNDGKLNADLTSTCLSTLQKTTAPARTESNIRKHYDTIQELCDCNNPIEFADNLKRLKTRSPWLETARDGFLSGSPTTAHLVFELRRRTLRLSLADVFRIEYGVSMQCVVHPDFREGIRSTLIDKDKSPVWTPDQLEKVTPEWIAAHFDPPCADANNPMNHSHCAVETLQ
tara:strand:+ start:161 stop:1303 length:1143 start_codon:yes stop_codon:yes gene_type:complete